jgi:hypothetical protein
MTAWQLEALLYEALASVHVDDGKLVLLGPDFEGRLAGLFRYGLWRPELRRASDLMQTLPLDLAV